MPFVKNKLQDIREEIDKALDQGAAPFAAFDADGTLWPSDLGRSFFNYQIENKLVDLPKNPISYYKEIEKNQGVPKALLWLAQINAGKNLDEVQSWAEESLKACANFKIFDFQKNIIDLLLKKEVKIFIVTASVNWAIAPGAKLYGLDKTSVVGVSTKVKDNIITDEQDGIITWGPRKVDRILKETKGRKPFFASGNSMADLDLLDLATHTKLTLASAKSDSEFYNTEQSLLKISKDRGWYFYD